MADALKNRTFFNLFPTPEYLSLSNSGIAIGDDGIKFLQLHHGLFGNGLTLSHHQKIPLPEGTVFGGLIYDPKNVIAALKEVKDTYGITYTRATLPEEKAYLFSAAIPRVPVEGLKDAVAFIIEENAPVKLAESVFDFDIISSSPELPKFEVTVAVLPKRIADSYMEVFQTAGLVPVSFDIESQAIARAAVPTGDASTWLVINIETKKTGFYIVEAGVVRFTTTLSFGSNQPGTTELKTEMRKIFAFWGAREVKPGSPQKKIEKALLCGTGALNNAFVEELMDECPVEYTWGNPWINVSSGGKAPPEFASEAMDFTATIGLALPHPHRPYV